MKFIQKSVGKQRMLTQALFSLSEVMPNALGG
jgi:hypothetical protein